MQVSFDFDEFLAFLLPGCFMFMSLEHLFPGMFDVFSQFKPVETDTYAFLVQVLAAGAVALVLGHMSSVFARQLIRRTLRKFFGNPRAKIFNSKEYKFWNPSFREVFFEKFENIFGYALVVNSPAGEIKNTDSAPRLIRSYVLNNYPATREIRNRIVRTRSLCGNSFLPILIFLISSIINSQWLMSFILALAGFLLLWKQYDLDIREWKEIYTAFTGSNTQI